MFITLKKLLAVPGTRQLVFGYVISYIKSGPWTFSGLVKRAESLFTHLRFLCPPVVFFVVRLPPLLPLLPVIPPPHVLLFLIQQEVVTRTFGKALNKTNSRAHTKKSGVSCDCVLLFVNENKINLTE